MTDILRVLAYFDLFDHPLRAEEISCFLSVNPSGAQLADALDTLLADHHIFRLRTFYTLRDDRSLARERNEATRRGARLLDTARRTSRTLYRFPYVRGVSISGSLSKGVASEQADIDYFIIVKDGRLWIARTLLHLFKKLTFLTGRQHRYCMNYFIDEGSLEIEERNCYTAMEIVTLLPACGYEVFNNFFAKNAWVRAYFPYAPFRRLDTGPSKGGQRLKRAVEAIFDGRRGDKLEARLMHATTQRWRRKECRRRLNMNGVRMGLRTGAHFCKPNPVYFQTEILGRYRARLRQLEQRCGVSLNAVP